MKNAVLLISMILAITSILPRQNKAPKPPKGAKKIAFDEILKMVEGINYQKFKFLTK